MESILHTHETTHRPQAPWATYDAEMYRHIVQRHMVSGGQCHTAIDVCPGDSRILQSLAPWFENVIGIDRTDDAMDEAAANVARVPQVTLRVVLALEEMGADLDPPLVPDGTVDLITVGTNAPDLNMDRFWRRAARMLRPGGTVAVMTEGRPCIGRGSAPNPAGIQAAVDEVYAAYDNLRTYTDFAAGDASLYCDLPMPWRLDPPELAFDHRFERNDFSFNTAEAEDHGHKFQRTSVRELQAILARPVPQLPGALSVHELAAAREDIVQRFGRRVIHIFHLAGIHTETKHVLVRTNTILVIVKKK